MINKLSMEFWAIICDMAPYLLLGFLIAGILHGIVPKTFYRKYLSKNNFLSVLYATLIGIPLPLCSCGVIPTAVSLKNEKASKGAVASFLIATPQTGIDSILATFSLMGLGFAVIRPVAALITGICGGLLVNMLLKEKADTNTTATKADEKPKNVLYGILHYAFFEMLQNIGFRLLTGLVLATAISVFIPDEFFLRFAEYPWLQMIIILAVSIPMYVCSTGSIPIATSLILKGLSPGAALVLLMAGPAVNLASMLVIKKTMGKHFTIIYVMSIVLGAVLFGGLVNMFQSFFIEGVHCTSDAACCNNRFDNISWLKIICAIIFSGLLINALLMKWFCKYRKTEKKTEEKIYRVEGMSCSHCKRSVESAVMSLENILSADADINKHTLKITGNAQTNEIKKKVEEAGFTFKGEIQ